MKRPKTYVKSDKQLRKERDRRRKLRKIAAQMLASGGWPSQQELAEMLGCSQATVSRDLEKLGRSRWNPFRLYMMQFMREIRLKMQEPLEQLKKQIADLSDSELISLGLGLWRKGKGKPRGKPFTSTYQPKKRQKLVIFKHKRGLRNERKTHTEKRSS